MRIADAPLLRTRNELNIEMLDFDADESFDKTSENLSLIPTTIPSHVKVS